MNANQIKIHGWRIKVLDQVYRFKKNRRVLYYRFCGRVLTSCDQQGNRMENTGAANRLPVGTLNVLHKQITNAARQGKQ